MLWRASFGGAAFLVLGRAFGAGREFILAREVGPTDELAAYVLASTILLAIAGLVSGVSSALVVRHAGSLKNISRLAIFLGAFTILGVVLYDVLYSVAHSHIFIIFAFSVPFYALYGIANGRLLSGGASFFGMLTSTIPAVASSLLLVLPVGSLVDRAVWGNLIGAAIMAALTVNRSRHIELSYVATQPSRLVVQATAIAAVSAINIASPIIDRFFASSFGAQDLVLLNLGAILYVGATTSLGLAMGNAAVSRESVGSPGFSFRALMIVPLVMGGLFMLLVPVFVNLVLSGAGYGSAAPKTLSGICFIYALATPCAILNQINMRLWNRSARARSMLVVAVSLLALNIICNIVFVSSFGVVGIAAATFSVQVVQAAVLGFLRSDLRLATMSIFGTVCLGGLLVVST